jgi:monothiol glutaredoxin
MPLNAGLRDRITSIIEQNDVVLFMKGNRMMPQCGFSGRVIQILDGLISEYDTVDVLADPEIRDGIKEYSSWPTIPQLYVKGELVGGCDIITDLYNSGELHTLFGLGAPSRTVPTIEVTDEAAARLREFLDRSPDKALTLTIDARNQPSLGLAPPQGSEIVAESNGIKVLMDLGTAARAEGTRIDAVEQNGGVGFRIDVPPSRGAAAPGVSAPKVAQLSALDVRKMLDDGVKFEFLDVRTPEERSIAAIDGARLLDEEAAVHIESLPKDTTLVFHCHHGGRSQAAAEHFARLGFTDVRNMAGGIDAWSNDVDPDVSRY